MADDSLPLGPVTCKTFDIEQRGPSTGSSLIRMRRDKTRVYLAATTDFSEAGLVMRVSDMIELANKILTVYGGVGK